MAVMTEPVQQFEFDGLNTGQRPRSGVGPTQWIKAAIENRLISSLHRIDDDQIQPASLDLRLSSDAFEVRASFLPGERGRVEDKLPLLTRRKFSLDNGAVLEKGKVYLVRLQEGVRLKSRERISGTTNPKSSTGRLDVFSRVICNCSTRFDTVPSGYSGPLWLEIAPRSFNVKVETGSRLAQLRLVSGTPPSSDAYMKTLKDSEGFVWGDDEGAFRVRNGALNLSVDVDGDPDSGLVGYKAKATDEYIEVDSRGKYEALDFWQPVYRPKDSVLILDLDQFYILATKEKIALPADLAADMVAYDTLVGEFRVHYAGFFDPGFGYTNDMAVGAKIVLEIRSHEVPFAIEHGQPVGSVVVQRMIEATSKPYGSEIGSSYQSQGLALGKQFRR